MRRSRIVAWLLENDPLRYPWGSTTLLQQLSGTPFDGRPIAELWFGTHARHPSRIAPGRGSLLELMQHRGRTPGGMPFLLKLIAVAHPLSLQTHPNLDAARRGYQREQQQGIALDARTRSYPDPSHKPELLVALSDFRALVGLAPASEVSSVLEQIDSPTLRRLTAPLRERGQVGESFLNVLQGPPTERPAMLEALGVACRVNTGRGDAIGAKFETITVLLQLYPQDVGPLLALFLNEVRLRPGDGLFLAPGTLHAYLSGLGVEIMANSDNVLRCGLTGKHCDVAELLRVLDLDAGPRIITPEPTNVPGVSSYHAPVQEFVLERLQVDGTAMFVATRPEIVLSTSGGLRLVDDGQTLELPAAAAAYVDQGARYQLAGAGECFRARAGTAT